MAERNDTATLDNALEWGLILPIFVGGTAVNGTILTVMLLRRRDLLHNRIEKIYAALMAVCFLWSVSMVAKVAIWGIPAPKDDPTLQRVLAIETSLPVAMLFGSNVLLAMERFRILREIPWPKMRYWFYGSIAFTSSICATMMLSIITSPCSNANFPDYKPQLYAWLISVSAGFLIGFTTIIALYVSTFRYISQKLALSLADHHVSQLRHLIQRKILKNSIIMTVGVLICYLPLSIQTTLRSMKILDSSTAAGVLATDLTYTLTAMDVLITPCLILYFSARLSSCLLSCLGRGNGEDEVDEEDELEQDGQQEQQTVLQWRR